jgi:hypothetical protein
LAEDKSPKEYPLHGTVVAMRTERVAGSAPVYTDPYGKTHGGGTLMRRSEVYTIRTADMEYDVIAHKRDKFAIGDQVDFRWEGGKRGRVFVRSGDKDARFYLVGQRMRDKPALPEPAPK